MSITFLAEVLDLFDDASNPDNKHMTDKVDLLVQLNAVEAKSNIELYKDKCKLMHKDRFEGIDLKVSEVVALTYFRDDAGRLSFFAMNATDTQTLEFKEQYNKSKENIFTDLNFLFDND